MLKISKKHIHLRINSKTPTSKICSVLLILIICLVVMILIDILMRVGCFDWLSSWISSNTSNVVYVSLVICALQTLASTILPIPVFPFLVLLSNYMSVELFFGLVISLWLGFILGGSISYLMGHLLSKKKNLPPINTNIWYYFAFVIIPFFPTFAMSMYMGYSKQRYWKILFANFSMGCVGALVLIGSSYLFKSSESCVMLILEMVFLFFSTIAFITLKCAK